MKRRAFLKLILSIPAVVLLPRLETTTRKPWGMSQQWISVFAGKELLIRYGTPWKCKWVSLAARRMFWSQDLNETETLIVLPDGEHISEMVVSDDTGPIRIRYAD